MDEELKATLQAMMASIMEMRESIVGTVAPSSVTQNNSLTRTNSILEDISSVLKEQLSFFRAESRAQEFDEDKLSRTSSGGTGDSGSVYAADAPAPSKKAGGGGAGGGLLKTIMGFLGGAGAGIGAGLAGGGVLAIGIAAIMFALSNLMKTIEDLNAEAIKEKVVTLLSISDAVGGAGELLKEGGAFFLAMTGLGLGLAVFALGSGVMAAVNFFTKESDFAETVKDQVLTLLSISDEMDGGAGRMLKEGGAFFVSMLGLGLGLAAFALGSGVMAAVDMFTKGRNWAERVKDNVVTLLSISDEVGGAGRMLKDGGAFYLAMLGLGLGLAAFAVGSAVEAAVGLFRAPNWAQTVKDNVLTLLSISDEAGGRENLQGESGAFFLSMLGLGLGLAAFAVGSAVEAAVSFFREPDWADRVKYNVLTLLSIADELGGKGAAVLEAGTFASIMTMIGMGLAAFGFGEAAASVGAAITKFSGTDDFAQTIKDKVLTLLSLSDEFGEGDDRGSKISKFKQGMTDLSLGLLAFTGSNLAGQLGNVGSAILGFFGVDSPFDQLMQVAENADDLQKAGNALTAITASLGGNIGTGEQFKTFAANLKEGAEDIRDALDAMIEGGSRAARERREQVIIALSNLASDGVSGTPARTGVSELSDDAVVDEATRRAAEGVNPTNNVLSSVSSASNNTNSFNTNQLFITSPGGAESTIQKLIEAEVF